MRSLLTALVAVAAISAAAWATPARADERSAFQLLPTTPAVATDATSVDVTPVRWGVGWRGYGYYGGWNRPYYGGGWNRPYYGGYYGGYYGYRPYYNTYRPYYGYGYRYW